MRLVRVSAVRQPTLSPGRVFERLGSRADTGQRYALYQPSAYATDRRPSATGRQPLGSFGSCNRTARALERIFMHTAFYLPREAFAGPPAETARAYAPPARRRS